MGRSHHLSEAWEALESGSLELAVARTRAVWDELDVDERHEAWLLLGLTNDAMGNPGEAVRCFRQLCQGSEKADDWCHLAVAALRAGDKQLSQEAFEQVRLCHQVSHYVQRPGLFVHLFYYANAQFNAGDRDATRALLDEIGDGLRRLPNVDPALLVSRGMPTFPGVIELAVRHFRAAKTPDAGTSWLQALGEGLDAESQRQVSHAMKELRETDGQ